MGIYYDKVFPKREFPCGNDAWKKLYRDNLVFTVNLSLVWFIRIFKNNWMNFFNLDGFSDYIRVSRIDKSKS